MLTIGMNGKLQRKEIQTVKDEDGGNTPVGVAVFEVSSIGYSDDREREGGGCDTRGGVTIIVQDMDTMDKLKVGRHYRLTLKEDELVSGNAGSPG